MKKINYKKAKIIMWILMAVGFLIAFLPQLIMAAINPFGQAQDFNDICIYVGFGFIFLGLIEGIIFVRCPHCGRGLDLNFTWYNYCPYCGKDMDKEE